MYILSLRIVILFSIDLLLMRIVAHKGRVRDESHHRCVITITMKMEICVGLPTGVVEKMYKKKKLSLRIRGRPQDADNKITVTIG